MSGGYITWWDYLSRVSKKRTGAPARARAREAARKGCFPQFVPVTFRADALREPWKGLLQQGVTARNLVMYHRLYITPTVSLTVRGNARLSINSSSQDINVLYIVPSRIRGTEGHRRCSPGRTRKAHPAYNRPRGASSALCKPSSIPCAVE